MCIILNNKITYDSLNKILESFNEFIYKKQTRTNTTINVSLANINFVEPAGVVLLSNILEYLTQNNLVQLQIPAFENIGLAKHCPHKYLDDSGFYTYFLGNKLNENSKVRSTTLPLSNIKTTERYQWLIYTFQPWLAQILNVSTRQLGTFSEILSEILNNIEDHSHKNNGFIFAQYYPSKNKINIAISDFGVGIPDNMKKVYPNLLDGELIKKALEPSITSQSTPRNRGAGLDTLVYNTVINSKGIVRIRSNNGEVIVNPLNNNEMCIQHLHTKDYYPGTFIELELEPQKLIEPLEEEDFHWD